VAPTLPADAAPPAGEDWESQLASLLAELSGAQEELLSLLAHKQQYIISGDHHGLAGLREDEQRLGARLQACHDRRQQLLERADQQGLPAQSLVTLHGALPAGTLGGPGHEALGAGLQSARQRAQLIRHECLAQWVAVQRSVLHLSHLLEIIATGGRAEPTYGNKDQAGPSGSLMDQAV
jgi:hypothetical protein